MVNSMWQDLRYACRTLVNAPGFTVVALLTLTLGIGSNVTIFSFVNALYLAPLPYKNPEQLVRVLRVDLERGGRLGRIALRDIEDWKTGTSVFEDVAAYSARHFNLTGMDSPQRLLGCITTYNLLSLLGVTPALGRDFLPEDDRPGAERVVILSDAMWRRRLGGDANALGSSIELNGDLYTIVGIMPADFVFLRLEPDLFTLYRVGRDPWQTDHRAPSAMGLARISGGSSVERSQKELSQLAERLAKEYPNSNKGWDFRVEPLREAVLPSRRIRLGLPIMTAAVGFVFLIACVNVANLLLARGKARHRELALRAALGAGWTRLVRQLLTESAVLASVGGALGLMAARAGIQAIVAASPVEDGGVFSLAMDTTVLVFVAVSIALATLLFGLLPAMRAASGQAAEALKSARGSTTRSHRLSRALVIAELTLACVILSAAVVLIRSVIALNTKELGFSPEGILTMDIALPESEYPRDGDHTRFYERVEETVSAIPGVLAVGSTNNLTLTGADFRGPVELLDRTEGELRLRDVSLRSVSPGYFRALSVQVRRGRPFTLSDDQAAPRVSIINNAAARLWFDAENPIGQRLIAWDGQEREIIGVVQDFYEVRLDIPVEPAVYSPAAQAPTRNRSLAVLSRAEPSSMAKVVERAIWSVDADQPVHRVVPMEEWVARQAWPFKMMTALLAIFAGLALIIGAAGIYGVASYGVVECTGEIGVRMALGASASHVMRMFLGEALRRTAVALVIGLAASFLIVGVLERVLTAVEASDFLPYLLVAVVLGTVTIAATYLPAVRAARLDPTVALRYD